MPKYNQKSKGTSATQVATHQGGVGFKLTLEHEFIGLLATGLEKDYYEKGSDKEKRLINLMQEIALKGNDSIYFLAQAIVYARSVMGQRTVTHRASAELAKLASGLPWASKFFSKRNRKQNSGGVIYRLDDILEITAAHWSCNKKQAGSSKRLRPPLTNAMRAGFARALEASDTYEIAKYQGGTRNIKLRDIVNLVRPKPSPKMEDTFKLLMKGELRQQNTVEDKNTKSGQSVSEKLKAGEITDKEAKEELKELKGANFAELIREGQIGYLALLRNLRQILLSDSSLVKEAGEFLSDPGRVKKSLVFPHQIDIAIEVLANEFNTTQGRVLRTYLDKAYELATLNLGELGFDEHSAIVVDTSDSMRSAASSGNRGVINSSRLEKGMLIAATLAKGTGADLYHFATRAEELTYNLSDSINTTKNRLIGFNGRVGHGTSFESIFNALKKGYKRVFIISDMQGGDQIIQKSSLQSYKRKFDVNPYIYSIDLAGYGTTMFKPNDRLIKLYGYGADIYESLKKVELDPDVVITEIRKVNI